MRSFNIVAILALLCAQTLAEHVSKYCPSSDICYQINIPETTAKSGSGDIYFQIAGSAEYSWIGLGQGTMMKGANIFVMYAAGNGNVTVSPRLGKGEVQPLYDSATMVTLLEGSGVADGRMVANVRCNNCANWSGGSMDFASDSASWIYASLTGSALESSAPDENIMQHNDHGQFAWSFAKAQGGPNANPFVASGTKVSPFPGKTSSTSPPASSSSAASSPPSVSELVIVVHGSIASMAFVALFPIGAILLRIPDLRGAIWIHAAVQMLAYISFVCAVGLGIYIAMVQEELMDAHPIIGLTLFCVLFFQPISGLIHHNMFKKHEKRTLSSWIHVWIGRAAVLLGMINGGLGLLLVGQESYHPQYVDAYIVVASVMGAAFIAAAILGEVRRRKRAPVEEEASREESGKDIHTDSAGESPIDGTKESF